MFVQLQLLYWYALCVVSLHFHPGVQSVSHVSVVVLQCVPVGHPQLEHLFMSVPVSQYFGFVCEHPPYGVPSLHVCGGLGCMHTSTHELNPYSSPMLSTHLSHSSHSVSESQSPSPSWHLQVSEQ